MKKIFTIMIMFVFIFTVGMNVIATSTQVTNPYDVNKVDPNLQNATKNIWATVIIVVRVIAVGAVVFAGLRYMFASSEQKADVKKGLIYLAIGAVLVFGATIVIDVVRKAGNEVMNTNNTISPSWQNHYRDKQDEIINQRDYEL